MSDGTDPVDLAADIIDSRDIIERIAYLRQSWTDATGDEPDDYALSEDDWRVGLDDDEAAELVTLLAVAEDGKGLADWQYGEQLIRDSYFVEFAQSLAEDIGAIPDDHSWPASYIDWERAADALQVDYLSIEVDGTTYWARG